MTKFTRIINFKRIFEYKYNEYEDINIWKETDEDIILYERDKDNSIRIYRFIKQNAKIEKIADLKHNGNSNKEYISIDIIDNHYIFYTIAGDRDLNYYKYHRNSQKSEIIFSGKYSYSIILNNNYILVGTEWDDNRNYELVLLDLRSRKEYLIQDDEFKFTDLASTRVIKLNNEKYLAHTKTLLGTYDAEDIYINDIDTTAPQGSGVYVMKYDKWLEEIKSGSKSLTWEFIMESKLGIYIDSVTYGNFIDDFILINNYHFTYTDFNKKEMTLYKIIKRHNNIQANIVKTISYNGYEDSYNLGAYKYPVEISKSTYIGDYSEDRVFYPFNYIFKSKSQNHESLIDVLEDVIVTWAWGEPGEDEYYEVIRIRDKKTNELIEEVEGCGFVLNDGKTVFIY